MADTMHGAEPRADRSRNAAAPFEKEGWDADARFYLTMAIVSAVIIFVGFAPSFYLKSVIHAPPPLSLLTVTHGLVFTAWVALFVTQAALIATKRPALHRRLGVMGALLFGIMITLGFWVALAGGRLGHAPPGAPAPLSFMALPIFAMIAATVLVGAALWNRQRSAWHKRLMLASLFIMTGPAVGRIAIPIGLAPQGSQLAIVVAELLLAIAILHDYRSHRHIHRAYLAAVGVFAVFHIAVTWGFASPAWFNFASALVAS